MKPIKELATRPVSCDTGSMVGNAIREARMSKRLTLDDVAAAVGVSKSCVSRVELGRPTTSVVLERVASAVGLELVVRKRAKAG